MDESLANREALRLDLSTEALKNDVLEAVRALKLPKRKIGVNRTVSEEKCAEDAADLVHRLNARGGRREDGTMPVAHAYRVTLRVAKKYRVRDGDLIEAAFLHDTGEDYAQELAEMYNATSGAPLLPNREGALAFIDNHFGGITAFTVGALSHEPNGPDDSEETKIQNYGEYIAGLAHSPRALIIKTADIFDNVTNPSPNPKQKYYSMKKYLFAIEPLMRGIERNATTLNAMSREWDPASGEPEKLSDALLRDLHTAKMVAVALLARPIPA